MIRAKIPCMNFRVNSLGAITIGGPQFRSSVDLDSDPERVCPRRYSADASSNVIILPCAPAWRPKSKPRPPSSRRSQRNFPPPDASRLSSESVWAACQDRNDVLDRQTQTLFPRSRQKPGVTNSPSLVARPQLQPLSSEALQLVAEDVTRAV